MPAVLLDSEDSVERETNGTLTPSQTFLVLLFGYCFDIQAQLPIDSALLPDPSGTSTKESGEETGVGVKYVVQITHTHTHTHTQMRHAFSPKHTHALVCAHPCTFSHVTTAAPCGKKSREEE